jgi:multicomponent Na+:H+ antiporter subunit D
VSEVVPLPVLPVLLLAVPLLFAALLAAVGPWLPRVLADITSTTVAVACLVGSAWLTARVGGGRVVQWVGGWSPDEGRSVGIALVSDRVAAGAVVVAAGLTALALVYSWRFVEDVSATYHVLVLVLLASMTGFALAGDLFNAFVWFELMGVAAYALTGLRVEEPRSVHGALVFGIVNTLGASFSLVGIALLYARTGELNMALVGERLRAGPSPADQLVTVACALLLAGVLVKAAAVPFHFWTADAEAVAPTPVCALISGAMVALGVYAVARWWWVLFVDVLAPETMRHALLGVGAVTAAVGAVMCVGQRHIKRLLAYSTISHVGLFLLGVALLDEHGLTAAALYVVGHACVKGALFLGSGVLLNRFRTVDEHALFGRGARLPSTAGIFLVGGLGLAGLPPLGAWLGKSLLEHAVVAAHLHWLVPLTLLSSVLTGGAVLRVYARVFVGLGADPRRPQEPVATEAPEAPEAETVPGRAWVSMLVPAWLLLAGSVVVGTVPGVHRGATVAAAAFVDTSAYVAEVLRTGGLGATAAGATSAVWTFSAVGLGLLSATLAASVAAVALWGGALPTRLRQLVGPVLTARRGLHAVHAGHLGSYVAWVVLGVAVLTVVMA